MIKTVEKIQTEDGRLFDDKSKALKHSELLSEMNDLLQSIDAIKEDPGCKWANGDGFYQLTSKQVQDFIEGFQKLCRKYTGIEEKFIEHPKGFIGRYLCDGDSPLYRVWSILNQIDSQNRYWGQQYFANNPNEGKQVNLTK